MNMEISIIEELAMHRQKETRGEEEQQQQVRLQEGQKYYCGHGDEASRGVITKSSSSTTSTSTSTTTRNVWTDEMELLRSQICILKEQISMGQERERQLRSELTLERDLRVRLQKDYEHNLASIVSSTTPTSSNTRNDDCTRNDDTTATRSESTASINSSATSSTETEKIKQQEEEDLLHDIKGEVQGCDEEMAYEAAPTGQERRRSIFTLGGRRGRGFSLPNLWGSNKKDDKDFVSHGEENSNQYHDSRNTKIKIRLYTEEEVDILLRRLSSRDKEIKDLENFIECNTKIIHAMQYQMQNIGRFYK